MIFPDSVNTIAQKIKAMEIRGAGRIARAGSEALIEMANASKSVSSESFYNEILAAARMINATRPTAVSLPNGLRFVLKKLKVAYEQEKPVGELKEIVRRAATEFIENSNSAVERIGQIGARRLRDGDVLMTFCNSSAAIRVLETAAKDGKNITCYVAETRPRFQGHLTAKALSEAGVKVRLIVDSAIRYYVNQVNKVIVGADSIAANGAVVNKIGTSMLALAAHESRTDLYVAAETYKFSPETVTGHLIEVENRDSSEILKPSIHAAMPKVEVCNPAFDFTPPEYIDLIITEYGIIPPQFAITILHDMYGWTAFEDQLI